jgi:tetratricopeptide (TPR) repeat protein
VDAAGVFLDAAAGALGDAPEVRLNRAAFLAAKGRLDEAVALLDEDAGADGAAAAAAGNLLFKAGRFEEADERYRRALAAQGDNPEYLCGRASCLIERGLYGEADALLAKAHEAAPSPLVLELISHVAFKKGEFRRAEAACRAALEMEPRRAASLLALGRLLVSGGRNEEAQGVLATLTSLDPAESGGGSEELRRLIDSVFYHTIPCASCGREWKARKAPPPAPAKRLYAMPPDELPAGTCPVCGKSYSVGCAKQRLDDTGRFLCPACGQPLKLTSEGLRQLVYDWAAAQGSGG